MNAIRLPALFVCLSVLLLACPTMPSHENSEPIIPNYESFEMIILNEDCYDLHLGYDWEEALSILMNADTSESLFVIGLKEIEHYDWNTQVITLTIDATEALVGSLDSAVQNDRIKELMRMKESLGWGNIIENALEMKAFVVKVDGNSVYGGIFLYADSQRSTKYPVLRVTVVDNKAVIAVLPVHIPFVMVDPVTGSGNTEEFSFPDEFLDDARQLNKQGDWLTGLIQKHSTGDTANMFREIIRDPGIRAVLRAKGKFRE